MKLKPMLYVVLAGLFSGAALAQTPDPETPQPEKPAFNQLDADGDNYISQSEANNSWLAGYFTEVDSDNDGRISKIEYEKVVS
jgi:hypothetical protein